MGENWLQNPELVRWVEYTEKDDLLSQGNTSNTVSGVCQSSLIRMRASDCLLGSEEVQLNVRTLPRDRCGKTVELDKEEELVKKTSNLFHQMFKMSKPPLLEVHIILVMDIFRNLPSCICWKDGQIFFELNRQFPIDLLILSFRLF